MPSKSRTVPGRVKTRHYTEAEKIKTVAIYLSSGNAARTEDITGIPRETIYDWKTQPWWYDVSQKILKEQDDEIVSNFSRIVKKAQKQVEDRIENGDWVVLKNGTKQRVEMKGRDLTYATSSAITNRQLLLDRPTSRTEKVNVKDRLATLAEEFKRYSKAKEIIIEPETNE